MKFLCLAAIFISCASASAETGINTVVRLLEVRYSVRQHGIPGLWLAKPFMIGSGVSGMKVAEFPKFRVLARDTYSLRQQVEKCLGPEWHPFMEEWSKADGEWSLLLTKAKDQRISMLIVTSEHEDGVTVIQLNLSGRALREWVDEPESAKHNSAWLR